MSDTTSSAGWFAPAPPSIAVEVTSRRVTVASVSAARGRPTVGAYASEALPDGAVTPALAGLNIVAPDDVVAALGRALEQAGLRAARRAALVVPDHVARVSLVTLTDVPARPADLDTILRWQLRKSLPFPIGEARVAHFVAHADGASTTFATVAAREDVLAQYEGVTSALDIHAGIVDLAGFNVVNAILAGGRLDGDALVVCLAPESTTLAILRDGHLMFCRQRAAVHDEPLDTLVHQTAMYHRDRLGGATFRHVWLAGAASQSAESAGARAQIEQRLGLAVQEVDVRPLVGLKNRSITAADLDALAAPVGVILRESRVA